MDMLIDFIREMLPEGAHVPRSWYEAKKSITELELGHQKIDACKNDCILFQKEYEGREKCPICEAPRFKESLQEESQIDNQLCFNSVNQIVLVCLKINTNCM